MMLDLKKITGGAALAAAVVLPCMAEDFFFPEMPMFRMAQNGSSFSMKMSVRETGENFVIEMVTPGVAREEYSITAKNDLLTVAIGQNECQAEKEQKESCGKTCRFVKVFKLPANADRTKIKAVYKDGVMKISVPKVTEPEKPEIKIAIE